ncbi:sugar ABC transporter substrate-binding protein [Halanaerobium sp. ST460_2HS_T2]|uniref:ABC transporter substrate-binding protein n=1 Tax=Halanaerobium sp. ST460_2HS_T2 TaxID=2183914 RepID=UPI000DF2E70A|nr:sugar ABC transporter substrate-binding protein [Halanaerobium sp. ST460_2HS_T2]RCW52278.1 carbohydrate ABC transporter substrate-binding protein (CUT1 family) [Halanaerobium sp. ST460_2HS_T2]
MQKKLWIISLSALLVLCFAFTAYAQTTTIRYFMWDPEFKDLEQGLIDEFEAENPDIEVEFTALEPSNYWPKISAMASAGELPDVFNMSSGYIDQWAGDGLLMNIQDEVDKLPQDDYFTKVFSTLRYPDKESSDMYGIPYAWVTTVLYYNKDMFDEAGIDYPSDDWSWEDFRKAAQALTIDENDDGVAEQYGFWWYGRYAHVEPWIYANGGRILNEDKTRIAVDAKAKEALNFLADLSNEYNVSPPKRDIVGIRQQDMFPLQQTAMWVDGSWNVAHVRQMGEGAFDWGIAKVPQGPSAEAGEYEAYGWPDSLVISKESKHKEAAWKLVKYLIGKNRPLESYMAGKVPINKSLANSDEWLEKDKQPAEMNIILELGEMMGRTSFTPGWGEWRGYADTGGAGMNGVLDSITNGEMTVEEAVETFTKYGNEVLERYYPEE